MRTRLLFIVAALFCIVINGWSLPRTQQEIQAIAKQHFEKRTTTRSTNFSTEFIIPSSQLLTQTRSTVAEEVFYIFSTEKDGFVIVSADDRLKPILGYADTGSFKTENLPDNILNWFQFYANEFAAISADNSTNENRITINTSTTRSSFPATVSPLLGDIAWNQSEPYNNNCPLVGTEKTVTGCVATAMAQIMMYHKYPDTGQGGAKRYNTKTLGLLVATNFTNATFQWNKLLPYYDYDDTSESAGLVAELMYNCGAAVEMDYNVASTGGSGAYDKDVPTALVNYFKYDENIQIYPRDYYSYAEWLTLIKTELAENRPIYYTGQSLDGGHAFVVDGYDTQDLVHVNWGWGGSNNGYFEFTAMDPASHGIGGGVGGFNSGQNMLIGIQRPTGTSKYKSQLVTNESLEISNTSISRNSSFSLTWNPIYNFGTKFNGGQLGVALYKDGTVKEILKTHDAGEREYYSGWARFTNSGLTISNNISAGNYQLYVVAKDDRESDWVQVRARHEEVGYFDVNITSSQITFTAPNVSPDFTATSYESLHKLYSGKSGDFKLKVRNSGAETIRTMGIIFQSVTNPDDDKVVVASTVASMPTGEEKELELSGTVNVSAGEYKVLPAYLLGGDDWILIPTDGEDYTVTVHPEPEGNIALALTKTAELAVNVIKPGEALDVTLSIKNNGIVYDEYIYFPVFEVGGGDYSVAMTYTKVFIDAGETKEITFTEQPNIIKEGSYNIQPRYLKDGSLGNVLHYDGVFRIPFTISSTTGIANEANEKAFSVYPTPVDDILNIKAWENIRKVEIFNMAGSAIKQITENIEAGSTYTVSVSDLPAGIYFLQVQTENNVFGSKFIKK